MRPILILLGILMMSEVAARLLAPLPAAEPGRPELSRIDPAAREAAAALTRSDDALLWSNAPQARFPAAAEEPAVAEEQQPKPIRLDADGMRESAPAGTAQPQEASRGDKAGEARRALRILCLGDENTLGLHVEDAATWPAQMEAVLRQRFPDVEFTAWNAGTPGWSWVQGEAFLRRRIAELRPDVVVAALGPGSLPVEVTDAELLWRNVHPLGEEPRAGRGLARLAEQSRLIGLLDEHLAPPPVASSAKTSPACESQSARGAECRRVSVPEVAAGVHRMHELAAAAGSDLVLLHLDFAGSGIAEALRQAALRDDLTLVDPVEARRKAGLQQAMLEAHAVGLAFPSVPFVPFGRIGVPLPQGRRPRILLRLHQPADAPAAHAQGHGVERSTDSFDVELHDDGLEGDERAADGVASAFVTLPEGASGLRYRFVRGSSAEPEGLRPDGVPLRSVRFNRDAIAAVARFGNLDGMADSEHPDAQGFARIGAAVADAVAGTTAGKHATGDSAQP